LYIKDGVAYAGDPNPILGVRHVRPLDGYQLLVSYSNGEKRITDMTSLLDRPAFQPLKDKSVFDRISVEYGIPMWLDGEIDISPEWLYEHGTNAQ
jgi:hypothetical protein